MNEDRAQGAAPEDSGKEVGTESTGGDRRWAMVPLEILGMGLTGREYDLFTAMSLCAGRPSGLCAAGERHLAEMIGRSRRVVRDANFHPDAPTKVDFDREDRAPLLFIGFGEDHVMPPKVVGHNEEKYDDSVSITEYKEFPGRPHFPGVPGWEEVADYALSWSVEHAAQGAQAATGAGRTTPSQGG